MKNTKYLPVTCFTIIIMLILPNCLKSQINNALVIDTAKFDAITVNGAGDDGVFLKNCAYGLYILNTKNEGIWVKDAGNVGVRVVDSKEDGLAVVNGKIGVTVENTLNTGILLTNTGGNGIDINGAGGDGIYVINSSGFAGDFHGNVNVTGTLSKGMGTFKIDHPLYPQDKFLYHSFVESPDMMNVYNGTVTLNDYGEATVKLPQYFEALNKDFRYQLTSIGAFAPLFIKKEIANNRFVIAGGTPHLKVSWQVTGVRHDPLAEKNRVRVEVDKSANEKGLYLHPEAYDLPAEKALNWKKQQALQRKSKNVSNENKAKLD